MPLKIEWDERQADLNKKKHGSHLRLVRFFGDFLSLTIPDPRHSEDEERLSSSEGLKNKDSLSWSIPKEGIASG